MTLGALINGFLKGRKTQGWKWAPRGPGNKSVLSVLIFTLLRRRDWYSAGFTLTKTHKHNPSETPDHVLCVRDTWNERWSEILSRDNDGDGTFLNRCLGFLKRATAGQVKRIFVSIRAVVWPLLLLKSSYYVWHQWQPLKAAAPSHVVQTHTHTHTPAVGRRPFNRGTDCILSTQNTMCGLKGFETLVHCIYRGIVLVQRW